MVDGELVVLQGGRADFPALLRRHQCQRGDPRAAGAFPQRLPVRYVLFDLLFDRGRCLPQEALVQRRARLRELLVALDEPVLAYSAGVVGCGREFFAQVVAQGHEGVLAKDRASRYRPGHRSSAWRIKTGKAAASPFAEPTTPVTAPWDHSTLQLLRFCEPAIPGPPRYGRHAESYGYAAIVRALRTQKDRARFRKTAPGRFARA
jgi:hypothetical protein